MLHEKFVSDAIFIKLGWLEVGAVGQLGIAALILLALIYVAARLIIRPRRS